MFGAFTETFRRDNGISFQDVCQEKKREDFLSDKKAMKTEEKVKSSPDEIAVISYRQGLG